MIFTKSIKIFLLFLIFGLVSFTQINSVLAISNGYLFYGQGCPHCEKVINFFQKNNIFQKLNLEKKEIYFHRDNLQDFLKICQKENISKSRQGVPMLFYHGQCIIGDQYIINFVKKNILRESSAQPNKTNANQSQTTNQNKMRQIQPISLLAVIGGSIADSINPCAFAVLILLMATILSSGNRQKALLSGLTFTAAIFISYFLMGLGIYHALATAKMSMLFSKIIAGIAIIIGLANIKDVFWYGKGFVMEVPFSWRPNLQKIIRSITSPISAFFVGFLVSLFLLPCTSGPYIAILGMLSQKANQAQSIFYLLIYNLIFIIPMVLITLAVYFGLNVRKAEKIRREKIRLIHLIVGIIMIAIGLWLWFT